MEHNFNNIIEPSLSLDDIIKIESAKEQFEKKIKENKARLNRTVELIIENKELYSQSKGKTQWDVELIIANKELALRDEQNANQAAELIIVKKELALQIEEKVKRDAKLIIANKDKVKRSVEFDTACKELAFQIRQKSNRAAELVIANNELAFQIGEKADMAAALIIANKELAFQNEEKGKRAAELIIANNKLTISNEKLVLQSRKNAEWAEKLIVANKEQGEYFVNISHELKTPLNVINAAAQLFEMYCDSGSLDDKRGSIIKYINSTKQNCYRLSKLINNIVDLSKIEAGFLKLNLSNNNIVQAVEKMVTSVTAFTDSKDLSIIFDTNTEEKIIAFDSEKIERMVLNLISNAIKFSSIGDEIFVQVKDRNEFVEILVKDNGIGIEEKDLDIIFDRFKQVDKSLTRNTEGTGVGLSLVKSIVELHGGSIHVESEVGKGSKFTVKLPSRKVCQENMLYDSNMRNENESIKVEFSDVYL